MHSNVGCWLQNLISDDDLLFWGSETSNKHPMTPMVLLEKLLEEGKKFSILFKVFQNCVKILRGTPRFSIKHSNNLVYWSAYCFTVMVYSYRGAESRTWARGQLKYDGFPVL